MKYSININWSDDDNCYIAKAPAFPHLSADGETMQEALEDIQSVIELAIGSLEDDGHPVPVEDRALLELRRYSPVLNLSALARRAGLNKHTLATKIKRGTRFTEDEASAIEKALP